MVRKWRESQDLTQEELGLACPQKQVRQRIYDIETGRSSTSVETLLNVIRGLDVPGKNDQERLARFFQGPAATWSEMVAERAETAYGAIRDLRKELAPRPKRKRAR